MGVMVGPSPESLTGARKRVLIFSLSYYPRFVGGAEIAIRELTDRLAHEYEFDMVTLRRRACQCERIGNVNVYRVGLPWGRSRNSRNLLISKLLFPFRALRKAAALHRTRHYDLVWGLMASSAGFASLFFKIYHPRVPYLLSLQEGEPLDEISRRMRWVSPLFRMIFTRADRIYAVSRELADFASANGHQRRAAVIPNGVDLSRFVKPHTRIPGTEGVVLVTTSRLVPKNAVDDVIRALAILPEQVRFFIYGKGGNEKLRALARQCGVSGRTHFMGHVDHEQLPDALAASDIFVRPSRSEGMGLSFIEAMAAGLPVIATQTGGLSELVFDAERNPDVPTTGWAVDPDAPDQIAAVVNEILAEPEKVEAVRTNALHLVRSTYDWVLIAKEMKAVLNSLTDDRDL